MSFRLILSLLFVLCVSASTDAPEETDDGDFYLIQFRRSITAETLARLTDAIGYTPTEFVPRNAIIAWIDTSHVAEPLEDLPLLVGGIKYVHQLDRKYRSMDIRKMLGSLRVQQRRFNRIPLRNGSAIADKASISSVDNSITFTDAFERDTSGALVVQLIVKCRQSLREEKLRIIANSHSRTLVTILKSEKRHGSAAIDDDTGNTVPE